VLDKETTIGLQKLANEIQQHVATLNSLGVSVGHEIIVHILENKLPKSTLEKWKTSLEKDKFPKPDQLYEFLYKTAIVASKCEKSKNVEIENHPVKRRQVGPAKQIFTVNTSRDCPICKTTPSVLMREIQAIVRTETYRRHKRRETLLQLSTLASR